MAVQAYSRVTFTKVENYSIVFRLNDVQCDVLNYDTVKSSDSVSFEADFYNDDVACVMTKSIIACYDADGNVLGSPLEVSDSSEIVVDGGNLYLSKDCKNIICKAYIGEQLKCTSSIPVVRNGIDGVDGKDGEVIRLVLETTPFADVWDGETYSATFKLHVFTHKGSEEEQDVTSTIGNNRFRWTRTTDSDTNDQGWNENHENIGPTINLTESDLSTTSNTYFLFVFLSATDTKKVLKSLKITI